ncbi:MAG TPA: CoA-binding protein [Methylocella sp.]
MSNDAYPDAFLRDILAAVKTIAVVGASDKETRPSHGVFAYLLARGYHVIGVNPGLAGKSVHGAAFFKTLADVPSRSHCDPCRAPRAPATALRGHNP